MQQVLDFFQNLFDTSNWPPRWHCGNWSDFHGWLYIISDLLIWSAYFAIPLTILRYISNRLNAKFVRAYFLFAAFILACGSTHLLDAVSFWFPTYRLNALVRFITGVVSWVTVFYLIRIMPEASNLRPHTDMEKEINERGRIEEELRIANTQLNVAQEIARIGHWEWDVLQNKIFWSNELYKIFGLQPGTPLNYDAYLKYLHEEDKDFVNEAIQQAFATGKFPNFTHRIKTPDGTEKILQARGDVILSPEGQVIRMIGTAQDVTEQQRGEQQLIERTKELENMNAELQKFAYVASHDLQEPLRKIMTFASLLEKETANEVSSNGKMYMEKVMQSAGRMQRLIDDILQFSSLSASKSDYQQTNLNVIIGQVLSDIEVLISNNAAVILKESLPIIEAIPSQMGQLFQNILSNAIKFKKSDEPPRIMITSHLLSLEQLSSKYAWVDERYQTAGGLSYNWSREQFVQIVITDNGIGFNETYADKIFEIFQRLHPAKTYEGTGIGLAICKKIVDNHHGTITAEGKPGVGASFEIILPVSQKNFLNQ